VASENLVDDPGLEAVLISIRQEEAVGAENGRILVLRPAEYSLLQLVCEKGVCLPRINQLQDACLGLVGELILCALSFNSCWSRGRLP